MKKVLAAAILAMSLGCTRGGVSTASSPAEACPGLRNLLVDNDAGTSVDVYAVDGNANLIGTVGPGRSELPIPVTVTTTRFRAAIRGPIAGGTSARRLLSRVSYQITCRASQHSS